MNNWESLYNRFCEVRSRRENSLEREERDLEAELVLRRWAECAGVEVLGDLARYADERARNLAVQAGGYVSVQRSMSIEQARPAAPCIGYVSLTLGGSSVCIYATLVGNGRLFVHMVPLGEPRRRGQRLRCIPGCLVVRNGDGYELHDASEDPNAPAATMPVEELVFRSFDTLIDLVIVATENLDAGGIATYQRSH